MNLLKGSSGKGGHIHEQMGEFQVWNENYKQIEMLAKHTHSKRDEECLFGVLSRLDIAEKKVKNLKIGQ